MSQRDIEKCLVRNKKSCIFMPVAYTQKVIFTLIFFADKLRRIHAMQSPVKEAIDMVIETETKSLDHTRDQS